MFIFQTYVIYFQPYHCSAVSQNSYLLLTVIVELHVMIDMHDTYLILIVRAHIVFKIKLYIKNYQHKNSFISLN